jgi:multicomponent Na+:H+ antiporter subunit D
MSADILIVLCLIIPSLAVVGILLAYKTPNLREGVGLFAALLLIVCVGFLTHAFVNSYATTLVVGEILPGLAIVFTPEPMGILFALIASVLWVVAIIYSIGYLRGNDEQHQTRFFACFALSIAATMGIALAGNFFTLFLFYEVLTLATWPLVTHHGDEAARRAGRMYLGTLMGTSICLLLPAMIAIWFVSGSTDFVAGGLLADKASPLLTLGLLALCMLGVGKAALMPVHRWLPNAMVAPTPVSALLHAVAVVKAGVFTIVKLIVYVFGTQHLQQGGVTDWLTLLAAFTIVASSVVALNADNLKRRLAYSTISQLSYVTLSVSLLGPLSVLAAALHIAAHAVGKITLFFAAGAIYTTTHKTLVSELRGIGRRMPWTMAAFAIAALSMIGLPPTVGFVSKWFMLSGAMSAESTFGSMVAVTAIIISTLLNAAYFLPIVYHAFFSDECVDDHPLNAKDIAHSGKALHVPEQANVDSAVNADSNVRVDGGVHSHGDAPLSMRVALVFTAGLTLLLFFMADALLSLVGSLN